MYLGIVIVVVVWCIVWCDRLLCVSDYLCASFAVVEVVSEPDHSTRAGVRRADS